MLKMLIKVFIVYLVILHAVIAAFIFNPRVVDKIREILDFDKPEIGRNYFEMLEYHLRIDNSLLKIQDPVLFIGDSAIQSLCVPCIIPNAVNFGIGRDTTLGVLKRIRKYRSIHHAKAIVLQVGFNDLRYRSDNDIIDSYEKIFSLIPQDKLLVVGAIWPIDANVRKDLKDYHERIGILNHALESKCYLRSNCKYFNIINILSDNEGNLRPDLHIGDGVHLNADGYEIVIEAMRALFSRSLDKSLSSEWKSC